MEQKPIIPLDKNQIVHFRLFSSNPTYYPYGKSIAAAARAVYKSLKMMEDAMLIYRLTRAPERRIFILMLVIYPQVKLNIIFLSNRINLKKKSTLIVKQAKLILDLIQ